MDLIHAEDIAKANILGINSDVSNEFFNVGSGKETKVSELAEIMMEIMGSKTPINFVPEDTQKVKNRRSSTEKIKSLLGFIPQISPIEGLTIYINKMNDSKNR